MTTKHQARGGRRHHVRIYLKQGNVVAYGVASAGELARVELVGFTPARTTPGSVLQLAGELLSRAHLAGAVALTLRDTDPSVVESLTYLLDCVGVPIVHVEGNE